MGTIIILVIFGLITGSFLNVCIYRIPQKKSIISPGSYCPKCKVPILPYHNIPVISYIFLKGKCYHCHQSISFIYPIVEFINALFYFLLFSKFGLSLSFFIYSLFISSLIIISFIDLEHQIIPDVITLPFILLGIIISFFPNGINIYDSLLGGIIGFVIFYLLSLYKQGMGGGDIKFIAMIGTFLGKKVIITIILSSFIGAIIGILLILLKKKSLQDKIPFGPFLSIAAIITIFFSEQIIDL